jgi:16S rRNA G1207 methylase RsmC
MIDIDVSIGGKPFRLKSARGIFSSDKVDKGSAVLVRFLQSERGAHFWSGVGGKNVLDIGSGWGLFALETALANRTANVYAVDINTHAVAITKENAVALGLDNVHAHTPDDLPQLKYDLLISNPPIRIGKEKTLELLNSYLERLNGGGVALFVIQKNLGADSIATLLAKSYQVHKLSSSKGFRILEVSRG